MVLWPVFRLGYSFIITKPFWFYSAEIATVPVHVEMVTWTGQTAGGWAVGGVAGDPVTF